MRVLALISMLLGFVIPVAAQSECPLPPRLTTAGVGEVSITDGEPLNIRSAPSRSAEVVGTLPERSRFDVLGDSRCADGILWWQVQTGWIAEGVDDVYFVRPIASDTLNTEAQFAAAPLFDFAAVDADRRLLIRSGNALRLTGNALNPLLDFPAEDGTWTTYRQGGAAISRDRSELRIRHLDPSIDLTIPIPSEIDGRRFLNALPSPDGSSIAWLYSNCESVFGCAPGTGYVLSLTDIHGQDRRTLWEGVPLDVGRFRIVGWRSDSEAVILEWFGTAPFPEPGSPVYSEPGYPPEADRFEINADGSSESGTYNLFTALSDDGIWQVARETGNGNDNLHVLSRTSGVEYVVPYPGYWLATQFSFSPQNSTLVWAETNYANNELDSVTLKSLNLADGTVAELVDFPSGYAFVQGWLSESVVMVQWTDLQWNAEYRLVQNVLEELAFDVTTGELWRVDLPQDAMLLGID